MRVKNLYIDFVNNYLSAERKFSDSDSLANKFIECTRKKPYRNYCKFTSGKYTDYCEKKSPQDKTKTCKDIGSTFYGYYVNYTLTFN